MRKHPHPEGPPPRENSSSTLFPSPQRSSVADSIPLLDVDEDINSYSSEGLQRRSILFGTPYDSAISPSAANQPQTAARSDEEPVAIPSVRSSADSESVESVPLMHSDVTTPGRLRGRGWDDDHSDYHSSDVPSPISRESSGNSVTESVVSVPSRSGRRVRNGGGFANLQDSVTLAHANAAMHKVSFPVDEPLKVVPLRSSSSLVFGPAHRYQNIDSPSPTVDRSIFSTIVGSRADSPVPGSNYTSDSSPESLNNSNTSRPPSSADNESRMPKLQRYSSLASMNVRPIVFEGRSHSRPNLSMIAARQVVPSRRSIDSSEDVDRDRSDSITSNVSLASALGRRVESEGLMSRESSEAFFFAPMQDTLRSHLSHRRIVGLNDSLGCEHAALLRANKIFQSPGSGNLDSLSHTSSTSRMHRSLSWDSAADAGSSSQLHLGAMIESFKYRPVHHNQKKGSTEQASAAVGPVIIHTRVPKSTGEIADILDRVQNVPPGNRSSFTPRTSQSLQGTSSTNTMRTMTSPRYVVDMDDIDRQSCQSDSSKSNSPPSPRSANKNSPPSPRSDYSSARRKSVVMMRRSSSRPLKSALLASLSKPDLNSNGVSRQNSVKNADAKAVVADSKKSETDSQDTESKNAVSKDPSKEQSQQPANSDKQASVSVPASAPAPASKPGPAPALSAASVQEESFFQWLKSGTRKMYKDWKFAQRVAEDEEKTLRIKEKWMMHPLSRRRLRWDALVFFLIMYQLFAISFRICFNVPDDYALLGIDALCDILLLADMPVQVFTVIEVGVDLIVDRKELRKRYCKSSRFLIDCVSNIPFDFLQIIYGISPLFRVNRLLRTLRYNAYFDTWAKSSSLSPSTIRIISYVVFLTLFVHYFACLWFLVVRLEGGARNVDGYSYWADILQRGMWNQYVCSMVVSINTLFGYGNIWPNTDSQLLVSLGMVLFGAVALSIVVGSATDLMRNQSSSEDELRKKLESLREFMRFRNIDLNIEKDIVGYYKYLSDTQQGSSGTDIFSELPSSLFKEISMFLNKDVLQKVPLFKNCPPSFIEMISTKLQPMVFMPGKLLIRFGETGKEMFFLSKGRVEVTNADGTIVFATLPEGAFFGEIALLSSAKRNANIRAGKDCVCEVYRLTKQDFDAVLIDYPETREEIQKIAAARAQASAKK
eukprot:ANDGO_05834.mRNA.1 Cyclic nucleotide-gated cation channel subunit A